MTDDISAQSPWIRLPGYDIAAARARVRQARPGTRFDELVRIAGLDRARDLRRGDWSGIDFSGCDLHGFDFSGARLWDCDFYHASITGARFDKAELGRAPAATGGKQSDVVLLHQHPDWPEVCREWRRSESPTSDLYLPRHTIFRDAPFAPEMVVIPAGRFTMGSPEDEPERYDDEGPHHEVTIESPFAMGRFAVTFDEYDWFCKATRAKKPRDQGWGRGRRPVINVSCEDAERYCAWLSEKTGEEYRLPSEAEWEYACRAGSMTSFWWGSTITPKQANYRSSSAKEEVWGKGTWGKSVWGATTDAARTEPVDAFESNSWGLYQMHGNVMEWCAHAWNDSYDGAPNDGSIWRAGDTSLAALRGGSWGNDPLRLRSAERNWSSRDNRNGNVGFRVSRTLRGR